MDWIDCYELIREIYKIHNPEVDFDYDELEDSLLEQFLYETFSIDFDNFMKLMEDIIKFAPVLKSPLTGTFHHCLGIQHDSGLFQAIIKVPYEKSKVSEVQE